ncbi:MAG: hypothetical protein K0B02_04580 [DPANN group archaeon]|nr:hypothetical protein [DPANN group archaeon]
MELFEKLKDFVTDAKDNIVDRLPGRSNDIDSMLKNDRSTSSEGRKPYSANVLEGSKPFESTLDKSDFMQTPTQPQSGINNIGMSQNTNFNQQVQQAPPTTYQNTQTLGHSTGALDIGGSMDLARHLGVEHPLEQRINEQNSFQTTNFQPNPVSPQTQNPFQDSQNTTQNQFQNPQSITQNPFPNPQSITQNPMQQQPINPDPFLTFQQTQTNNLLQQDTFNPNNNSQNPTNLDSIKMDIKQLKVQQELILEKLNLIEERTRRLG